MTSWPPAFPALKEEESSEEEATAAAPGQEQELVPAELGAQAPEPLGDFPKHEDREGSLPETSLPYKWVVEAANILIPAVESGLSEALDLIESVMLVAGLPGGPCVPLAGSTCAPRRMSFRLLIISLTWLSRCQVPSQGLAAPREWRCCPYFQGAPDSPVKPGVVGQAPQQKWGDRALRGWGGGGVHSSTEEHWHSWQGRQSGFLERTPGRLGAWGCGGECVLVTRGEPPRATLAVGCASWGGLQWGLRFSG